MKKNVVILALILSISSLGWIYGYQNQTYQILTLSISQSQVVMTPATGDTFPTGLTFCRFVMVFRNGVLQREGATADFTFNSNKTTVTYPAGVLVKGPERPDVFQFVCFH
jgi:hypothetical protein